MATEPVAPVDVVASPAPEPDPAPEPEPAPPSTARGGSDDGDAGMLPTPSSGVGLQAALELQGRHLLRTLDGLADGGRERDIARRFRAGETPAAIATTLHMPPAEVVRLLRGMGFRNRKDDRHDNSGNAAAPASSLPFERRGSLATLMGGETPSTGASNVTPISAGVRMGRRRTDPKIAPGDLSGDLSGDLKNPRRPAESD